MTYRLWRGSAFLADVKAFGRYCDDYQDEFAAEQLARLGFAVDTLIAGAPFTWSFFVHSGPPHRAYLFRVGQRTRFWIVYSIDEKSSTVKLARLWNAAQDPRRFSV